MGSRESARNTRWLLYVNYKKCPNWTDTKVDIGSMHTLHVCDGEIHTHFEGAETAPALALELGRAFRGRKGMTPGPGPSGDYMERTTLVPSNYGSHLYL